MEINVKTTIRYIVFADPGAGMLCNAESPEDARNIAARVPLFRFSSIGVMDWETAPAAEKIAANLRGPVQAQTLVIPTANQLKLFPGVVL